MGTSPEYITVEFGTVTTRLDGSSKKNRVMQFGEVSLEKKSIYLDKRKKISAKEIISVDVIQNISLAINTSSGHILCQSPKNLKNFDLFCRKLERLVAKNNGRSTQNSESLQPRGPTTPSYSNSSKPTPKRKMKGDGKAKKNQELAMRNNHNVIDKEVKDTSRNPAAHRPNPRNDSSPVANEASDHGEDESMVVQGKRHTKSLSVKTRRLINDGSDDDEVAPLLTTPSATAQRVTPSYTGLTKATPGKKFKDTLPSDDSEYEESEEDFYIAGKNQSLMTKFFATKTQPPPMSFDPVKNYQRQQELAVLSPTLTPKSVPKSVLKKPKSYGLSAANNSEWLNSSQANSTSPKRQRQAALFGSQDTLKLKKPIPPIEQEDHQRQQELAVLSPTLTPKSVPNSVVKQPKNYGLSVANNSEWLNSSQANSTSPKRQRQAALFGSQDTLNLKKPIPSVEQEDPVDDGDDGNRPDITPPRTAKKEDVLAEMARAPGMPTLVGCSQRKRKFGSSPGEQDNRPSLSPATRGPLFGQASTSLLSDAARRTLVRQHRGLRNLGNTCYMNASLQMIAEWCKERLVMPPQFSSASLPLTSSLVAISRKILDDIPHDIRYQGQLTLNPEGLKRSIDAKTEKFLGYEQRDAHEFISDMIDHVHSELESKERDQGLVGNTYDLPTNDFCLTVQVNLECTICKYNRTKEEIYRHLSIDLPLAESDTDDTLAQLPDSLNKFFEKETREIRCERCVEGTHVNQTMIIISLPKMLLLHLKRFDVVEKPCEQLVGDENVHPDSSSSRSVVMDYEFRKNKKRVEILPELTLSPYQLISAEEQGTLVGRYSLQSVVYHIGRTPSSGHYTADALRPFIEDDKARDTQTTKSEDLNEDVKVLGEKNDDTAAQKDKAVNDPYKYKGQQWTAFDDTMVSRIKMSTIQESKNKQRQAYMLLYKLQERDQL